MPAFPDSTSSAVSPWSLVALMLLLVGLDLTGSLLAKEWSAARSPWLYVAGAASFVLLFSVFALGLRFAELSTVTFGWIVGVQAGRADHRAGPVRRPPADGKVGGDRVDRRDCRRT